MIRFEVRGRVAVATIDRTERRNALNAELCDELAGHLASIDVDTIGAIVIAGEGSAFCSGADLARRAADTGDGGGIEHGGGDSFRPAFDRFLQAIVEHALPVIAAVQGPAMGAGMQLAVACDFRVVGPKARFGIPAARLGVVLPSVNIARLERLVGSGVAGERLALDREDGDVPASRREGVGGGERAVDPAAPARGIAPRHVEEMGASAHRRRISGAVGVPGRPGARARETEVTRRRQGAGAPAGRLLPRVPHVTGARRDQARCPGPTTPEAPEESCARAYRAECRRR